MSANEQETAQTPVEKRLREALYERRTMQVPFHLDGVEARADGDELDVSGYAAVFDSDSLPIMGLFTESIKRGAFRKALRNSPDIPLLANHDGLPMARTTNGTLTLEEDAKGLRMNATLAPTTLGTDVYTLLKRGDLKGMSFAFMVESDKWEERSADMPHREILEFSDLFEVSIVTEPAYPDTTAQAEATGGEREAAKPDAEVAARLKRTALIPRRRRA